MNQNVIETLLGFVIISIAFVFFLLNYQGRKVDLNDSYNIKANFQSVEGIAKGSDVMIAGIKIGEVASMGLDNTTFEAIVTMNIKNNIEIPIDSRAAIVSTGLIGGKFVSITPGIEDQNLSNNDSLKFTQSSLNLESLIGKFMYSTGNGKSQ